MAELGGILLNILAPVFLLVGLGALAGRMLDLDARTLSKLSYWVLGPVFIFDILARADLALGLVARMVGASLLAMAVVGAAAVAASRALRRPTGVTGAVLTTSVYGNVGNFGLAIVAFTYGEEALPLAGILFLSINLGGLLVGVAAAGWQRVRPLAALRGAFTAPMVLVVPPAVLVNGADLDLPLWVDRPVTLLAGALIPVMLLTLGIQLQGMGLPRVGPEVALSVALKLLAAPAAAAAFGVAVGLEGVPAGVLVLQSAMPAAVFTALVAYEHDMEPDLVTTIVMAGTLASALTLPVVIAWLT
jgi:predicted permease